jgi:hypothetical protein
MPFAYLPQYDYELDSAVLGGGIVAIGLWLAVLAIRLALLGALGVSIVRQYRRRS